MGIVTYVLFSVVLLSSVSRAALHRSVPIFNFSVFVRYLKNTGAKEWPQGLLLPSSLHQALLRHPQVVVDEY